MKKFKIILLFFIGFYSCNFKNSDKESEIVNHAADTLQKTITPVTKNNNIPADSIFSNKNEGKHTFNYKFNVDSSGYILKSIVIYSDNIPIQVITANKEISRKQFQLIDWNFDGFKDISVLYNCGSGGCAYWIWNYSNETKKYYYNKELSGYLGLEIDSISQYIIFHYRAGWQQEYWDSLKYKNDKLSFEKGLHVERWNNKNNRWEKRTYTKMTKNKLVTKVDSSIITEY